MAVQAAGAILDVRSGVLATRAALVDFLEAQLPLAGWSVENGAGTDTIDFATGPYPVTGLKARLQIDGSVVGAAPIDEKVYFAVAGHELGPTMFAESIQPHVIVEGRTEAALGMTWRLIASQHQFLLWADTMGGVIGAGNAVLYSFLFVPDFNGGIQEQRITCMGKVSTHSGSSDSGATFHDGVLWNGYSHTVIGNNTRAAPSGDGSISIGKFTGSADMRNAEFGESHAALFSDAYLVHEEETIGQLWDAFFLSGAEGDFEIGQTMTFDSRTYVCFGKGDGTTNHATYWMAITT